MVQINGTESMRRLMKEISEAYGVSPRDLIGRSRSKSVNLARREYCVRCYLELRKSYPQIGRSLDRHHTTIMYHVGFSRDPHSA